MSTNPDTTGKGNHSEPSTNTSSPPPPRRAIYVRETTGSYWSDFREAFKRLSFQDFQRINEIPCARKSLITGLVSGAGIGVVRGLSAGIRVGSHWSLGTFMIISLATWSTCQSSREQERRKLQHVVESMPKLVPKKQEGDGKPPE